MAKWIKNNSGETKTWLGQQLDDQTYYQLQGQEPTLWSSNSQFLIDMVNGLAVVAKDNSGSDDITDVVAALSFLKDEPFKNEQGIPLIAPTFEDYQGLTTVWKSHLYTATAGTLSIFDELVTTQIKVRGGWYELFDDKAAIGDYIEFSIIDKDDVLGLFSLYGLTVGVDILELKKFIRTEYINPIAFGKRQLFESNGASTVYAGLYLRVLYLSTGAQDVTFKVMEKYHEV